MAAPTSLREWWNKTSRWIALHPHWTLGLAVLAALGPFLARPFNMDDPLFIWIARQIHQHPGNPYGFLVNWYGSAEPMWNVTENPPLASYYLALAAGILGWSEPALHFAFLLPALAVILGTYRLARRWCDGPLLAAFAALFTPVFLVSSTTVMCDVLMLALWIWAVVWWVEGMEHNDFRRLAAAALLIALAALTKYFGACLIPLLAAYSLIHQRRLGWWAMCLLLPVAALGAYAWATRALYGHDLLSAAVDYAGSANKRSVVAAIGDGFATLVFTGGCLAVVTFFAPWLWRKRTLAAFAGGVVVFVGLVRSLGGVILKDQGALSGTSRTFAEFQIVFWAIGGVGALMLALTDVWRRRDAVAWLLGLWVLGTFCFTAFFNWTINGRSILPMVPVVGILLARRLEWNTRLGWKIRPRAAALCLAFSAALALLVTRADFLFAATVRRSAELVHARYGHEGGTLWFQGHWGFQYYLEGSGARALDVKNSPVKPADNLAIPAGNTSIYPVNEAMVTKRETFTVPGPRWLATWSEGAGAGFYASAGGPLPFAFGRVPPETVSVYALKPASAPPAQKAK